MKDRSGLGIVRLRRRALMLAIYGTCALGLGVSFAATPGGRTGTGTAPAAANRAVTPADKAAAEAQFDKAYALYQQKKYAEAQVENEKALKLDPSNVNAVLMQSTLKSALAGGTLTQSPGGTASTAGSGEKIQVLTLQQVYKIRLMELGPGDRQVVGRIDPKVLEDFWQNVALKDPLGDKSNAAHTAFINPNNFTGQVRRIRDSRDSKYMEQITLTTDPAVFVAYRNNVQMYVLQGCATAECHGDKGLGGNFRLLNPATTPEQQYTNYFILSQYANRDGQMLDRDTPEKSLLLQYALPWADATLKHPKVDVKKLTGPTDSRGRAIANWIRALPIPKPVYGIAYEVPGATIAASVPATAATPATGTAPAPK